MSSCFLSIFLIKYLCIVSCGYFIEDFVAVTNQSRLGNYDLHVMLYGSVIVQYFIKIELIHLKQLLIINNDIINISMIFLSSLIRFKLIDLIISLENDDKTTEHQKNLLYFQTVCF
jgi:hypothetical protein